MKTSLKVPPLNWSLKLLDILLTPLMYFLSGALSEKAQRGHFWNNKRLSKEEIRSLKKEMMVYCHDVTNGMRSRWLFLYHIPIICTKKRGHQRMACWVHNGY